MKNITKQQATELLINYFTKTSNHLFLINDNTYYKLELVNENGKYYVVKYLITDGKAKISVSDLLTDAFFEYYKNDSISVTKDKYFPNFNKTKSIPYFKKMRTLIADLSSQIKMDTRIKYELPVLVDLSK